MKASTGIKSNPRKPPAHLLVSLKRGTIESSSGESSENVNVNGYRPSTMLQTRQLSDDSNQSSVPGVDEWYARSSRKPPKIDLTGFEDDDPPYFNPVTGATRSGESDSNGQDGRYGTDSQDRASFNIMGDGSIGEYRDIVDDLTVKLRKLRNKIRMLQGSRNVYQEESRNGFHETEKLFEVHYHGLSYADRKELQEILRKFAANIRVVNSEVNNDRSIALYAADNTPVSQPNKTPSRPGRNSRPGDCSYDSTRKLEPISASIHNSAIPTPATTCASNNQAGISKRPKPLSQEAKDKDIRTFLDDIPGGIPPKHLLPMTESQKRKEVVKRLEQIFTGKISKSKGFPFPSQQQIQTFLQQEVSDSAANGQPSEIGLRREANIIPTGMEMDETQPSELSDQSSLDSVLTPDSSTIERQRQLRQRLPDQRRTHPLDLDVDRQQIPGDNVEYIRHLGLSTPQLITSDSSDVKMNADGWVYLNLLVNMAQLHILNVTPDFVRSSVKAMSTKFQLSTDGKKLRWRGGTEGTRLSSDSDNSSPTGIHENEGDSDTSQKAQINEQSSKASLNLNPTRLEGGSSGFSKTVASLENPFRYVPMFPHSRFPDETTSTEHTSSSESPSEMDLDVNVGASRHGKSSSLKRAKDGPVAFFRGANFFTDLSSDSSNILTPIHVVGIGKDGYSSHTEDALGCSEVRPVSTLSRTSSGSSIPVRPFETSLANNLHDFQTPELITGRDTSDSEQDDGWNLVEWSSTPSPDGGFVDLQASGIGGTRPDDHFNISVLETQQTIHGQVLMHSKIIKTTILPPSELPVPSAFYPKLSSESSSGSGNTSGISSHSGLSPFRKPIEFHQQRIISTVRPDTRPQPAHEGLNDGRNTVEKNVADEEKEAEDDEDDDDEDTDSSIDMLAQLRRIDPAGVAAWEHQFEMEIDEPEDVPNHAISALSGHGGSGFSTSSTDESMDSYDEEDDDEESM